MADNENATAIQRLKNEIEGLKQKASDSEGSVAEANAMFAVAGATLEIALAIRETSEDNLTLSKLARLAQGA